MHFERTDDQVALQDGVRSFLEGRFGIERVVALAESTGRAPGSGEAGRAPGSGQAGVDRAAWRELAEMGLFSLRLPEADGGVGLGWVESVLAFEELGRAIVPGPLVWTHLVAGAVDGAATGDVIVGGIERDDGSGIVEHPDGIDVLVVLDDDGLWSVARAELDLDPVTDVLDPLTPVARLRGPVPQGERVLDASAVAALRLQGAALVAATHLGIAQATTDLAVAYAKERTQFDRAIGSFQALKHLMADMLIRSEVARGAVYAAGVTLDDPEVGSVRRAVASAAITASEAAIANTKASVQVHGGMGYTWEVPVHWQLKRAYALDPLFGDPDHHAEVMADELVALGGAPS